MKVKDKTFIKLYKNYYLLDLKNVKLSNQRAKSFTILKRYESLAYKLDLPEIWKIYSVISIIMLKSAFKKDNLYYRSRLKEQFITNIKNLDIKNRYEIKKLINR